MSILPFRRTVLTWVAVASLVAAWATSARGGHIYGFSQDFPQTFVYRVNPQDGTTTPVALAPSADPRVAYNPRTGEFHCVDVINGPVGASGSPSRYRVFSAINLESRSVRIVRSEVVTGGYYQGLSYNPADQLVYALTSDAQGDYRLDKFDPRTGKLLGFSAINLRSPLFQVACFTFDSAGHLWTISRDDTKSPSVSYLLEQFDLRQNSLLTFVEIPVQDGEWYGSSILVDPDNKAIYTYHATFFGPPNWQPSRLEFGTLDYAGHFTAVESSAPAVLHLVWIP